MDITESLAPTSDQLDAIELVSGPRTFVVESVSKGSIEQPVQVALEGFPRVWRPSKGMRRVLAAGWGVDASKWAGRSVTLYFDPDVSFGKDRTGGTRISHMSDLPGNKRLSVPLLISRGKSQMFTVEPLTDPAPRAARKPAADKPTREQMQAIGDGFRGAAITDNAEKARFIAEAIGRTPAGWDDLTAAEAQAVIDELKALTAPADEAPGFEGMDEPA